MKANVARNPKKDRQIGNQVLLSMLASNLVVALLTQQLVRTTAAQSRVFRNSPSEFNPIGAVLYAPIGMWDQQLSWQDGGEWGWVLLTLFGVWAPILFGNRRYAWLPVGFLCTFIVFLIYHTGRVNPVGTALYFEDWGWRLLALVAVFFGALLVHRTFERARIKNET